MSIFSFELHIPVTRRNCNSKLIVRLFNPIEKSKLSSKEEKAAHCPLHCFDDALEGDDHVGTFPLLETHWAERGIPSVRSVHSLYIQGKVFK